MKWHFFQHQLKLILSDYTVSTKLKWSRSMIHYNGIYSLCHSEFTVRLCSSDHCMVLLKYNKPCCPRKSSFHFDICYLRPFSTDHSNDAWNMRNVWPWAIGSISFDIINLVFSLLYITILLWSYRQTLYVKEDHCMAHANFAGKPIVEMWNSSSNDSVICTRINCTHTHTIVNILSSTFHHISTHITFPFSFRPV